MKLLKLNNIQANKITGIYNNIWAIDIVWKIENNFWVMESIGPFNKSYGIAKRFIKRLVASGNITEIDMSVDSPERTKIREAFKEKRNSIEYKGKHITSEL